MATERAVPAELEAFARAIEDIPSAYDDSTHGKLAAALALLANVLRDGDPEAARRIDVHATQLMRVPPHERGNADVARAAIEEALESLAKRSPRRPEPGVRDAYVAATRARARISDERPLRFQLEDVAAALRSVANMAALVHGAPPVFGPPIEDVRVAYDPVELRRRSLRLSEDVAALAAERSWVHGGAKAAAALHALADVLAVSPLALDEFRWRRLVSEVHYEAMRLERLAAMSLDRSDHVKAGLAATQRAFDSLAGARPDAVAHLATHARAAVERVDANTAFVFQRAQIQEAFRTATDVFLLIGHGACTRGESSSQSL